MFSRILKIFKLNKTSETISNRPFETDIDSEISSTPDLDLELEQKHLSSSTSIRDASLTTRTINSLLANGIDTIGKLQKLNINEFKNQRNVGKKTVEELINYLKSNKYNITDNSEKHEKQITPNKDITHSAVIEEMDSHIYNYELNKIGLSANIISFFEKNNIKTIGNFLEKIEWIKNINTLEIRNKDIDAIYEQLKSYGICKYKKYKPVTINTPDCYFFKVTEMFEDNWIVDACKKHNINNIGLLASEFPDVFSQDEELIKQEIFFEKIKDIETKLNELGITQTPIVLSYWEEKELLKKDLCELYKTNYIQLLRSVIINAINNSKDYCETYKQFKAQLNEKEIDIISRRYGINCEKQTLEEIAQFYNCTRERIRQLEKKSLSKMSTLIQSDFQIINDEIIQLLKSLGNIISYNKEENLPIDYILVDILNTKCSSFDIDIDNYFITTKDFKFDNLKNDIIDAFDKTEKSFDDCEMEKTIKKVLSKYLNNETPEQKQNYSNVYDKILSILISNNDIVQIDEGLYKLIITTNRRSKKERDEKLLYWFEKLYPNGIHMPIEKEKESQLIKSLQPLYEKCEEIKKLGVRSITDRLIKDNKDVIWWDRGLYIHVNNINVDWNTVDYAISEVIKKFDEGLYRLKPSVIYEEYKDKFITANIPNEIALVGLIRYKKNPRINTKRDELRDADNSNLDMNILETFENFILQYPDGISTEDLFEELCNKRGWKPHQIAFLYSRSDSVYCNYGTYYHMNNFTINENKINELINVIQRELDNSESPFVHLRKIRSKYPAIWKDIIDIDVSPNFMGRILSTKLKDRDFVIDNYIYAKKTEHYNEDISYSTIINKFLEEQSTENEYVTLEEVMDFCKTKGLNNYKHLIINFVERCSFEYGDEIYVHKEVLGYTDEFQEDLFALLQVISEKTFESPLIKYDDIISNYKNLLPSLNEGYEWNRYLLRSILKSNENVDTFEKTFIFKENRFGVEDLDDTAAYLIIKSGKGNCSYGELDQLMAQNGVTQSKHLHLYKSRLFFEGSSIKLSNDNSVSVEQFALDKYLNK